MIALINLQENLMVRSRHLLVGSQAQIEVLVATHKDGAVLFVTALTSFFYFFSFGMILLWRALTSG
jgi:hypothetical protein